MNLLRIIAALLAGLSGKFLAHGAVGEGDPHGLDEPSPESLEASPLPYREIISWLRSSGAVIPPSSEVHSVTTLYNREAIVPPQCYTKTQAFSNPCYVCHQAPVAGRENVMNDMDLQEAYSFSEPGMRNHWENLFEDRSGRIAGISDAGILDYISQDNYSELPGRLKAANFHGWIPDLRNLQLAAAAFNEEGFATDGSQWLAFSYKPFPSTFWPTNGSTDNVMIQLPERFRTDGSGRESADIYKANLAILEANIKGLEKIGCLPVDEAALGRDLDGDGRMGIIRRIADVRSYVGAAKGEFLGRHLYPAGTEFLHTVRYVAISDSGEIVPSVRMKEVRYMRKWRAYAKPMYARRYQLEDFEKQAGNLPGYQNLGDWGLDNGNGWSIQGFIEDVNGRLRANTFEENFFCMGCHNSIGSTIDKTFSFARKVDGAAGWGYLSLKGMPDAPNMGEIRGEIATYLERVGGGSEFRNNKEMFSRWFHPVGSLNHEKVRQARDVYELITPSRERALLLNKAYKTIVDDQDYIFGRDAIVVPPENVHRRIDNEATPTLPASRIFKWNLVLDWPEESGDGGVAMRPGHDASVAPLRQME